MLMKDVLPRLRRERGLTQEELARRLYITRQAVSRWECGLSVPDATMLISLAEALGTTVSGLLGEGVSEVEADDVRVIAEKLEIINSQLARRADARRKVLCWSLVAVCVVITVTFVVLMALGSPYLGWNFSDPETAVAGTFFHAFEWLFVRLVPFVLLGAVAGIALVQKRRG